jgi:hypothetical protein
LYRQNEGRNKAPEIRVKTGKTGKTITTGKK